jgi:hypothetical protein
MITGPQALGTIERAIASQQSAVRETEARLEALLGEEEALRKADLEDFRQLAHLRLDDIARGEVFGRLERAERKALALLAEREQARAALEQELAVLDERLETLKRTREDCEKSLSSAQDAVVEAENATRARLETDAAYTAQATQAHKIDIQAANADEKAQQSEAELAEKRATYESNALFMYLWNRKFGTPDYAAFPLFRMLDRWVARLIGYTDARTNYFRLQEIPKRLREHADRLSEEAEAEEATLDEIWRAAREGDGLGALDAEVDAAASELARAHEAIDAATAEQENRLSELGRFSKGEDDQSVAALELLSEELRKRDLTTLFRDARETLRTEDDRLVRAILNRSQERQSIDTTRDALQTALSRRLDQLSELGSIAKDFKLRRFAQPNSGFRDGALIGMILKDLLDGATTRDRFWDQLSREQLWRRTTRSGGGALGRGGPFGDGTISRRRGGFGGGGRSSGGGGFRTGGGF